MIKADVHKKIKERYAKALKLVGAQAMPGTRLKRRLENFAIAASRATAGKLIDHHEHLWKSDLEMARREAGKEMNTFEKVRLEKCKRAEDIEEVEQGVEARATRRWRTAERGCDRAAALIKELKADLEGEA